MPQNKLSHQCIKLVFVVILGLIDFAIYSKPALAQSALAQSAIVASNPISDFVRRFWAAFSGSRQQGPPRGRAGGGAGRNPPICRDEKDQPPLTLLAPTNSALTNTGHPTFWVYVPSYSLTPDPKKFVLKFVIQDDKDHDVYRATFPRPETTSGVFGFHLPSREPALEAGKKYRWYFLVYCNDENQDYEPAYVEGLIQRNGDLSLSNRIQQTESLERIFVYNKNRMWYDMLTLLAETRYNNPEVDSLRDAWTHVLSKGFALDPKISQGEIVGRYVLPPSETAKKSFSQ